MSKRVFEVAKELGMASRELMDKIKSLGIDDSLTNTLSTISNEKIEELKAALGTGGGEEQTLDTGIVRRRAPRRRIVGAAEPDAEAPVPAAVEAAPEPTPEPEPKAEAPATPNRTRRFATVETRHDISATETVASDTPESVEREAEEPAPEAAPRSRFATITTRPAEAAAEPVKEPVREPAVQAREVEAPAPAPTPAPVAPAAPVEEPAAESAPRRRFATVVTRRAAEERAPVEKVEPKVEAVVEAPEEEAASPVRRFATVVTSNTEAPRHTPVELAAIARREADAASTRTASKGGAQILGTIDAETLNARTDRRAGGGPGGAPFDRRNDVRGTGPGPGPGAPPADDERRGGKKGKRVVQSGELYGKLQGGAGKRGAGKKGQGRRGQQPARPQQTVAAEHKRVVRMEEALLVSELAHQMGVKAGEIVMKLAFDLGLRGANINTPIDYDTAALIAEQYNFKVEKVGFDMSNYLPEYNDNEETLVTRPPVVTVMGHVDHGKTSLLDAIRNSVVATGEAGGITQHIGAYKVSVNDNEICFLDTPGHEAFTALRARGAMATDIVILVVAGDDGIMPQTVEAINHARDAEVPIVVAITKMDKPTSNPQRIRTELTQHGLIDEELGGDTMFVEVSSKTRMGIDRLLESVVIQAEVMELQANPDRRADGIVIESRLDVGRGPIATVLVQGGTLRVGDIVVIGQHYGRVRALTDEFGRALPLATPSTPVEISGLNGVPVSGEHFYVVAEEKAARAIAEHVGVQAKQAEMAHNATSGIRAMSGDAGLFDIDVLKELKVIVKADVQGSVEALVQSIQKLANDQVRVRVIHSGVGSITESDVNLATSSTAESSVLICGFNIRPEQRAVALAENNGVRILTHSIIYDMLDDVRRIMGGLLDPVYEDEVIGHAEVRKVFQISKVGAVAGCMITDGIIRRNAKARILRDNVIVFTSTVSSLRNVDRDEREMKAGFECGISIERYSDIKPGDIIECFITHERQAVLN